MKGLIDDSLYQYALAGIKPERHLEADGVTAISFPIRKITVILLVVLVVGKFFAAFFSHLRDDILHIHKVMHWLHHRKVCAAAIFFFFLNPSLLSFEAWPHVGLYIRLCYPLAPSASFASISVAVLSFHAGLTPSDRSPHGTSTETLFSDAPSWERAPA